MSETTAEVAPADSAQVANWGIPTALGAMLLSLAVYAVGASGLLALTDSSTRNPPLGLEVLGYQFLTLGVVVSAVLLVLMPHHRRLAALGYRYPGWARMVGAAASVVAIFYAVGLIALIFQKFFPGYHLQGNARELLQGHPHVPVWEQGLILLWAAVEVPFTEETLFRGILFQGLRHSFDRVLPYQLAVFLAALVSGAIFGLVHNQPHTLPILFFLGLALAYVFELGHSIYASALVHGIINAAAVISLFHGT